jgi:hypothetical protein
MRDLPNCPHRLAGRLGDLLKRQIEYLPQHEHRPLSRRQRLQNGQHRQRDALGELNVLGDVRGGQQRLGQPFADVLLAAPRERP